jgi:hypothetical protein
MDTRRGFETIAKGFQTFGKKIVDYAKKTLKTSFSANERPDGLQERR